MRILLVLTLRLHQSFLYMVLGFPNQLARSAAKTSMLAILVQERCANEGFAEDVQETFNH